MNASWKIHSGLLYGLLSGAYVATEVVVEYDIAVTYWIVVSLLALYRILK